MQKNRPICIHKNIAIGAGLHQAIDLSRQHDPWKGFLAEGGQKVSGKGLKEGHFHIIIKGILVIEKFEKDTKRINKQVGAFKVKPSSQNTIQLCYNLLILLSRFWCTLKDLIIIIIIK